MAICPGLAITLVDYRKDPDLPLVSIPFEFEADLIQKDDMVTVLDTEGEALGEVKVYDMRAPKFAGRTKIMRVQAPAEMAAARIAGMRMQDPRGDAADGALRGARADDTIICRCERVTGRRDPQADPQRSSMTSMRSKRSPGRHGGVRSEDLQQPDPPHVP